MANIAGGYVAGGVVAGQEQQRHAQSEDMANQSAQIDLQNKKDADVAYRIVMGQFVAQQQAQGAGPQAQAQPQQTAALPSTASAPQPEAQAQAQALPGTGTDAGVQTSPPPDQSAQALQTPPTPAAEGESAQGKEASALGSAEQGGGGAAPSDNAQPQPPSSPAEPSQGETAPAEATQQAAPPTSDQQKQMDSAVQQVSKSLGIDLTGIPRTVGGMQGLMAAQQHIEAYQKGQAQNELNQMYRSLQGSSEAEQAAGIVNYMKQKGIAGAPDGFTAKTMGPDGKTPGWYALHNGDQKGQFIPDIGGGLLNSMTRIMYGAIDRAGTISAGVQQENKMALESQKGRTMVAVESQKGKNAVEREKVKTAGISAIQDKKDAAAMEREKVRGQTALGVANVQGGSRVKAAGIIANGRNGGESYGKADAARDQKTIHDLDQLTKPTMPGMPGNKLTPAQAQERADAQARLTDYNRGRTGRAGRTSSGGGVVKDWRAYQTTAE